MTQYIHTYIYICITYIYMYRYSQLGFWGLLIAFYIGYQGAEELLGKARSAVPKWGSGASPLTTKIIVVVPCVWALTLGSLVQKNKFKRELTNKTLLISEGMAFWTLTRHCVCPHAITAPCVGAKSVPAPMRNFQGAAASELSGCGGELSSGFGI